MSTPDAFQRILAPLRDDDPDARRPLLIKIAPDLGEEQLEAVVRAVEKYRLAGIVAKTRSPRCRRASRPCSRR